MLRVVRAMQMPVVKSIFKTVSYVKTAVLSVSERLTRITIFGQID